MRSAALHLLLVLGFAAPSLGGSYLHTTICDLASGCAVGHPVSAPSNNINPQSIVHPLTFQQAGGSLSVALCTNADPASGLPGALDWAVERWNALSARTENCFRCTTHESGDPAPASIGYLLATVMLHEVGHCALALDHPDRIWDPQNDGSYERTSFTLSWNAQPNGIQAGQDTIRGSFDDTHQAAFGQLAESVAWFRRADNNPVIVDGTVIETATYSRSAATGLPAGHTWAANANRRVAESLGHGTTQAVMYSTIARGQLFNGLSADEVNMQKMSRTGSDLIAGTADDYTLQLVVVPCATPHDVEVSWAALGANGVLGQCTSAADYAYAQNTTLARVFKLVGPLSIAINSERSWITSVPLFADGFDSANTTAWSQSVP